MNVTLTCREAGMYAIRRGTQRWDPAPVVLACYAGWDVLHRGIGVGNHRSLRAAREWLDSPDGQKWLDAL